MKNDSVENTYTITMPQNRRWLGVGLASSALLVGCIESEEDLSADSVLDSETTLITDTGEGGWSEDDADEDVLPEGAADRDDLPFVPYEAIVQFRGPGGARDGLTARAQIEGITADMSLVRFTAEAGGRRAADDEIAATWALIEELRARGDVAYAQPNWLFAPSFVPNDAQYAAQWHYPQVNLPAAWDLTTGASTVRIAVIDTGRTSHPDLAARWLSGVEYDASNEDGDAASTSTWNHGVAVASVAGGATNNGAHAAGVCGGCTLLNVNAE